MAPRLRRKQEKPGSIPGTLTNGTGSENPSFGKSGVNAVAAKLTSEQVQEILKLSGSYKSIGAHFGVSKTTIERIKNGTSSYVRISH